MTITYDDYLPAGKRITRNHGYACFYQRWHPRASYGNGRVYLHRCIAERSQGRRLNQEQIVTFKDGNPENIDPANLEVTTRRHFARRRNRKVTLTCDRCGKTFCVPAAHREKRKFCSIACRTLSRRLFEVSPEELYALVWSRPTTEVAKVFGVSDKAIEKRCKRLGIPKPPRGYWLQISRAQQPAQH